MANTLTLSLSLVCSEAIYVDESSNGWIIDSGATKHVTKDRSGFREFQSIDVGCNKLYMGHNSSEDVLGIGDYFLPTSIGKTMVLHETLFVPGMRRNLLSVCRPTRDGFDFRFSRDRVSIRKNSSIYAWGFIVRE